MTVREAQDLLDKELARLPDALCAPMVLCYLEGLARDEAARRLGWSASIVKSRLEQVRERLRTRLVARGLSLSAVLTAALVADGATRASVPRVLLGATVNAATSASASISADVGSLTQGMVNAMAHRTMRILATVVIGLTLAGTTTGILTCPVTAEPPVPVLPTTPPAAVAEAPQLPAAARSVRVMILDPVGKPLAAANVHASIWTEEKGFKANHDYQTNGEGAAVVELPKSFYIIRLWASKKPFVEMFSHWEQNELASGVAVPAEYTIRLEAAVTAGGRVSTSRASRLWEPRSRSAFPTIRSRRKATAERATTLG